MGQNDRAALHGDEIALEQEDELDNSLCLMHPPGPFASMKALRRFVKENEQSKNRYVRQAVAHVLADIAHRKADPLLNQRFEDDWEKKRAVALAAVPEIKSDEDSMRAAARLIAEHGGEALSFAAKQRDELFHYLGEDEASKTWQKVVYAICELQPHEDRVQPISTRAEAALILVAHHLDTGLAVRYAAQQRDEARAKGEAAEAERWDQIIVQMHNMRVTDRMPRGPLS